MDWTKGFGFFIEEILDFEKQFARVLRHRRRHLDNLGRRGTGHVHDGAGFGAGRRGDLARH